MAGEKTERNYDRKNLFPSKKAAFTLAEVLITLGIIGVVAAMTIPTLVANYQKKQTAAALKKTYSTVQQAMLMSQIDNGSVETWDTSLRGNEFFAKYIANYVKYSTEYSAQELYNLAPRKNLNGTDNDGTTYSPQYDYSCHVILTDGSMVSFAFVENSEETNFWVGIDVNGLSNLIQ